MFSRKCQSLAKRGRGRPENRFSCFGPACGDFTALVEAAGEAERVLWSKSGEHHQAKGRPHLNWGGIQHSVSFSITPRSVRIRKAFGAFYVLDAFGRV